MRTINFGQLMCIERLHDERQICQAYLISNKPIFLALLEHALHDVVHAYDLILERMRVAGVDFNRILGISGDGQVRTLFPQLLCSCSRCDSPATWFSVLVGRCGTAPRLSRCFAASRGAIGSGRVLSSPRADLARFVHDPGVPRARGGHWRRSSSCGPYRQQGI